MFCALIIDDDPDLLEMVSLVIKNNGMKVECLGESQFLLKKIIDKRPDIILMDIYLGESDGRDLCLAIKKNPQLRMIPVILYSAANISADSIKKSLADDFIAKPFYIPQLQNSINKLLQKQRHE